MSSDRKMYNEEFKEEYLSKINGAENTRRFFLLSGEMEELLGKDLYEFTTNDILSFYKSLSSGSYLFLTNCNYIYNKYIRYCLSNHLVEDGQNHFAELDATNINACLSKNKIEDALLSYSDLIRHEDMFDNVADACLVQAVFEGISGVGYIELCELNVNQIKGNKLHLATRIIPISQRLISLMQQSSECYYMTTMPSAGAAPRELSLKSDDDRVFKAYTRTKDTGIEREKVRMYRRLVRIQEYMGKSRAFTFGNLRKSGLIDYIRKFVQADKCTVKEAILNHRKEIENQYSRIPSIKQFVGAYEQYILEED